MFFPKYSNIYPELKDVLYKRAEQSTNIWTQGGVSGLSSWVRLISAVDDGLVMESIHSPQSFDTVYGNFEKPGILGYALDMSTPIEIDGTGRGLRPSPIITSVNIDEKARGSLKITKISIKCFTKEQMDKIAQYFFEPGFHAVVEWGWNVHDSYSQRVGGGGPIDVCELASYDNWKTIKEKRKNSNYQYDATLGIITGGNVAFGESETFDISIQISGAGIAAEYMQTHRSGNRTDTAEDAISPSFEPEKVGKSTPGAALFKQMFNSLPNQKKLVKIYNWHAKPDKLGNNWAYEGNFVNFDEFARDSILESISKGTTITNKDDRVKIPTDVPLFDEERFIRFELAVEIMNAYAMELKPIESKLCPELISKNLTINIKDTPIKAFPHMWSTDKSVLYIPNTTAPNFSLRDALFGEPETEVRYIHYEDLNNNDYVANLHPLVKSAPENDERAQKNGSANDPATGQSRPVPFAFPCLYDLDETILNHDCDETVNPLKEKAGFWGWLKDLYINFDFFLECMEKPNYNSRDVLFEMLNGMSSGCNSLWDFQIMEQPITNDPNGPTQLTVVDFNFTGQTDPEDNEIARFQTRGTKSPFTSISFDMSVQGAMMSSTMIKKMSNDKVDGTGDGIVPMFGTVFSNREDKIGTILNTIQAAQNDAEDEAAIADTTEPEVLDDESDPEEEARARAFEIFAERAGIFSRYQDRKEVKSKVALDSVSSSIRTDIEKILCIGTWNDPTALKSVELIDRGLKDKAISGEQSRSDNNAQNPPIGLSKINFSLHGVSGFKVGDKIRFDGVPDKFGHPNFYQVMSVGHSISGNTWITNVNTEMRLIGKEE